jgi:hypothetical protein
MSAYPKRTLLDADTNIYWRRKKFEYDGLQRIMYYGTHVDAAAPDTDKNFVIHKFTSDVDGNVTDIQTLMGAWADRATLPW